MKVLKQSDTQIQDVLKYMTENPKRGITSMEAFSLFGITRLSSVIKSLRDAGYSIDTVEECGKNRRGGISRYGRYFLIEDDAV